MMQAAIALIAVIAGIIVGYWIRSRAAQTEKTLLDQRVREAAAALAASRSELATVQAESAARAGFESVAPNVPSPSSASLRSAMPHRPTGKPTTPLCATRPPASASSKQS